MDVLSKWPRLFRVLSHLLFWGFNVPLAFTVVRLLLEIQLPNLRELMVFLPFDILVTLIIFFAMPVVSVVAVLLTRSYRNPIKLLQILFGVELPIMAFTFGRLIFLKTLTPVNMLFLGTAGITITAYVIYVFKQPFRNKFWLVIHLLALQAAVVVGVYASLLMFFFLPIVAATMFQSDFIFQFWHYDSFWQAVTAIVTQAAFALLYLGLICSPFIGLFMYWRAANRLSKLVQFPRLGRWMFSLGYCGAIMFLAYQGSLAWFYSDMNLYQATTTFEERSHIATSILKRESFVKDRLVDIYLAHYRYLTDSEMTVLQQAYLDGLKLDQLAAQRLQKWFTAVAFPFVYNGKFEEDVKKAGEYYQDIFDEPIQLAESRKVAKTLASSFNLEDDRMKSSVLDREDRDVRLVRKIVSAQPDSTGQFATVTIEEEYENTTHSEQEVLYVFSLPQDSVITDLKLGADLELGMEQVEVARGSTNPQTSKDKNQGEIAAKGAANQTFENQYRLRIDPAILEQVGPVQYKLRVYPVPVNEENMASWQRERLREPVRNQKVRFSYVTALDANGQAALPKITETRNVFSDGETTFSYIAGGGQPNKLTDKSVSIQVVSRTLGGCGTQPVSLVTNAQLMLYVPHAINPWIKQENIVFDCQDKFKGAESTLRNKRVAILADASYSSGTKDWRAYLSQELPLTNLLNANTVDLYYFNDLVSEPINLNQRENDAKTWSQVAFGKTDRLGALKHVESKYDLVLMFTDGSEADEPVGTNAVPSIAGPIYMINKDGSVPKLTDNLTYYLLVNEARVVASGREAVQNFVVSQAVKKHMPNAFTLVGESGTWMSLPSSNAQVLPGLSVQAVTLSDPIAKVASHRQVESEMRNAASNLNQLAILDDLNRFARQSGIVSPFSSFIVLTTVEQKEQLKQASLRDDRYVVNYDLGGEQLIEPVAGGWLGTSAVPEPHEWVLMITGFGLVVMLGRHRVRALFQRVTC